MEQGIDEVINFESMLIVFQGYIIADNWEMQLGSWLESVMPNQKPPNRLQNFKIHQ